MCVFSDSVLYSIQGVAWGGKPEAGSVLGLIGFVFSGGLEWSFFVILCGIRGCVDFVVLRIGFVLRKRGAHGWQLG